jgi:hypothetical protein
MYMVPDPSSSGNGHSTEQPNGCADPQTCGSGGPDDQCDYCRAPSEPESTTDQTWRPLDEQRTGPARRVLAAARRRYHRLSITERPPLRQPYNIVALFTLPELVTLAECSCWPLPEHTLDWFARPPVADVRRRRRLRGWVASIVRDVLVEELPAAVTVLLERRAGDEAA